MAHPAVDPMTVNRDKIRPADRVLRAWLSRHGARRPLRAPCGPATPLLSALLAALLVAGCFLDEPSDPSVDTSPPAAVMDLRVAAVTESSLTLSWTAPGDDGASGTALAYDIRWSQKPITAESWSRDKPLSAPPKPRPAGTTETLAFDGLSAITPYSFALKAVDETGHWSAISNVVVDTTSHWADGGLALIPAGSFLMGSPASELGRSSDEHPHQVTIPSPLLVSIREVTQSEWLLVMGWNDSARRGQDLPVEYVTWYDCVSYCNRRSIRERLTPAYAIGRVIQSGDHLEYADVTWDRNADGYRLPTEEEWEYACRAGGTTAFALGEITHLYCAPLDPVLDQAGWYCGNASATTHRVGRRAANAWGLRDMHGNVGEWCWDVYDAYPTSAQTGTAVGAGVPLWVVRGGNFSTDARRCRSAERSAWESSLPNSAVGLRVVRTVR